MNAEELIIEKRDRIDDHWMKMEFISERFENHPNREWLDEHCVVKDIASEIPDDVEMIE